jgi:hypothetical protein
VFLKANYPDIDLASETEKDLLIRNLAYSENFASTHGVVAQLLRYSDFTQAQINEIVLAAISNTQVYWIIGDSDIKDFLESIIKDREHQIEPDNLAELKSYLEFTEEEDEIPF